MTFFKCQNLHPYFYLVYFKMNPISPRSTDSKFLGTLHLKWHFGVIMKTVQRWHEMNAFTLQLELHT